MLNNLLRRANRLHSADRAKSNATVSIATRYAVEALESRRLLTALLIGGTGAAEFITFDGTSYRVSTQGNPGPNIPVPAGTDIVQVLAGGGNDTVTINRTAPGIDVVIDAGTGNDTVNIGNGDLANINSTIAVDGRANGNDHLVFNDKHATPADTFGGYSLDNFTFNGGQVNFSRFNKITLKAADSNDFINLNSVGSGVTVTVEGNGGNDTLDTGANSLDGNNLGPIVFNGGAGNDQLDMNDQGNGSGGDYFVSSNAFTSNHSNLSITFAAIEGVALHGGSGDDVVDGADATVPLIFDMGDGADLVQGGSGNDTLQGDGGADNLVGNDGNDTLIGGEDGDVLVGNFGNDSLSGEGGDDGMDGGPDNDTYFFGDPFAPETDTVTEVAEPGVDTLDFAEIFSAATVNLTKDASLARMGNRVVNTSATGLAKNFENITGSPQPDTLIGNSAANVIKGGEGADKITGNGGTDTLDGQGGIDTINGVVEGSTDPASVLLQAENATLTGGTVVAKNQPGFTGTGFADFGGQNSAAQFGINRVAAGVVSVAIRYANGGPTERVLVVRVNGVDVVNFAAIPTGSFATWKTSTFDITLKAGANTIKLTASSAAGGPNVDSLTINRKVTLQAENATFAGGTKASSANSGFTGTGYADFGQKNSTVTFANVTRSTAGSATLTFRYANGSTANRPLSITVNGTVIGTRTFAPTGSWTNWTTIDVTVSLLSGNNTIKLTATGAEGPNLDSLVIT